MSDRMPQRLLFYHFLDTDGDGTGTRNAVGNYATGQDFYYAVPAGSRLVVERMIVSIEDGSGMTATTYGTIATLTNGVTVKVKNAANTTLLDLTAGEPVKDNSGWGHFCFDVDVKTWGGASPTNDVLVARWTFAKAGHPLVLDAGQKLVVTCSDNLTGLVHHMFMIQGYWVNRGI